MGPRGHAEDRPAAPGRRGTVVAAAAIVALNASFFSFPGRRRGLPFAAAALPAYWAFLLVCGAGLALGLLRHLGRPILASAVTSGAPLRLLALAAFVGGSVLAPVAHLAWHRPGHSHGADGRTVVHPQPHPHPHPQDDADVHPHEGHAHADHHGEALEPRRVAGTAAAGPENALTEPLEAPHGHGSLAHFGFALLSAPPPLELPDPAPAGVAPPEDRTHPDALHHPHFPLPRPPPGLVAS
jgi:hypothetical protein